LLTISDEITVPAGSRIAEAHEEAKERDERIVTSKPTGFNGTL
jgi:hypothetical protein